MKILKTLSPVVLATAASLLLGSAHAQVDSDCTGANPGTVTCNGPLDTPAGPAVYADGAVYIGGYVQGSKQGRGSMAWPSGARYFGDWHAGKPAGRGIAVLPDGSVYQGEWVDGFPEGVGRLTQADGTVLEGRWRAGQLQAPLAAP